MKQAVDQARQHGYSWAFIGTLIGTSGEAARQRYGHNRTPNPEIRSHIGRESQQPIYIRTRYAVVRRATVWRTDRVYPGPDLLREVGRATIAGSRLDVQMGMLWHHLDRNVKIGGQLPGADQCKRVRRLAAERLTGELLDQVDAAVVVEAGGTESSISTGC